MYGAIQKVRTPSRIELGRIELKSAWAISASLGSREKNLETETKLKKKYYITIECANKIFHDKK